MIKSATLPAARPALPAERVVLLTLAATAFAGLLSLLLVVGRPQAALMFGLGVLVLVGLAWKPVLGLYAAVAAVTAFGHSDVEAVQLWTAKVPLWISFSKFSGIPLLVFPVDMIIVAALAMAVVKRAHRRRGPVLPPNRLMLPIMAFTIALLYGLWRGMSHQDLQVTDPFYWRAAAAELHPLVYIPLLYALGVATIDSPRQLRLVIWVAVVGLGVKTLELAGITLRLGSAVFSLDEIAPHVDSVLISTLAPLALGLWVYRGSALKRWGVLTLLPFVAIALIGNQRRTAFIGLALALVICLVMLLADHPQRRRIGCVALVASLLALGYGAAFWKAEGPLAAPVYAFRSISQPDARKVDSNLFREMENLNIQHTIQRAPVGGLGFGQRYVMWIEEPSLDPAGMTYWRYTTHNSIYWLWIKLGLVGFIAYWYLIGSAIILGCLHLRSARNSDLKAIALTAVGVLAMLLMYGYADLGMSTGPSTAYLGIWLGILACLDRLRPQLARDSSSFRPEGALWKR